MCTSRECPHIFPELSEQSSFENFRSKYTLGPSDYRNSSRLPSIPFAVLQKLSDVKGRGHDTKRAKLVIPFSSGILIEDASSVSTNCPWNMALPVPTGDRDLECRGLESLNTSSARQVRSSAFRLFLRSSASRQRKLIE